MEKKWAVECWGDIGETELFYTEREARDYFKQLRSKLDSTQYLFTKDSIVDKKNPDNAIYLTNLNEL